MSQSLIKILRQQQQEQQNTAHGQQKDSSQRLLFKLRMLISEASALYQPISLTSPKREASDSIQEE